MADRIERDPGDGYVRIAGGQLRSWWRPSVARGAVVFVDVAAEGEDFESLRASMRAVPGGALVGAQWLLVRVPDDLRHIGEKVREIGSLSGAQLDLTEQAGDLEVRLGELGIAPPTVGLVRFPVGRPPEVWWSRPLTVGVDEGTLLHRARKAELRSVMAAQEAVSTPPSYHYRLPSGHHSASFVRVGDVFRDPRAGFTLSTWLRAGLDLGRRNVVIVDTGTIAPLVVELDAALRQVDQGRISLVALDEYPESAFEFRRAFAIAEAPEGAPPTQVLCILSVTSTRGMRNRTVHALERTAGPGAWRLESLVARGRVEASAVPTSHAAGVHEAWHAIGDLLDPVFASANCPLCRDPDRARLVTINPRNFAAKSLPEPQLLVPLLGDAIQNQSLWDRYDTLQPERDGGVSTPSVSYLGRTRELETDRQDTGGTYFEPAVLVAGGELGPIIKSRCDELTSLDPLARGKRFEGLQERIKEAVEKLAEVDIVVVDRDDANTLKAVLAAARVEAQTKDVDGPEHDNDIDDDVLKRLIGEGIAVLNVDGRRPSVLLIEGKDSTRSAQLEAVANDALGGQQPQVLLFTLGLRLGVTLQRLLVDVHEAWRGSSADPVVKGLVVHAHPEDSRAWAAVRNAFWHDGRSDLLTLWLTFLPHRSPLDEERLLLESAKDGAPSEVADVLGRRLEELRRPGPEAGIIRPFWSDEEERLRRTSYFGHEIHDRVTLAAVGSAMQRSRLINRPHDSPYWYRFDMPKVLRSYFDGLIHVAALRWMQPREGWWGATEEDQELLIAEARFQAPGDWPLVLAELLLASAQGKLPKHLRGRLLTEAKDALDSSEFPESAKPWIRLGRYLVQADLEPAAVPADAEIAPGPEPVGPVRA